MKQRMTQDEISLNTKSKQVNIGDPEQLGKV